MAVPLLPPDDIIFEPPEIYACGLRPMDDNIANLSLSPSYILYHAQSLKHLARLAIHAKKFSTSSLPQDLKTFVADTSDVLHFSTTTREMSGPLSSLAKVTAVERHPLDAQRENSVFWFRFDLVGCALRYLQLQKEIAEDKQLGDLTYVTEAIRRYEIFIAMQKRHPKVILNPPLDIKAVWLAHLIRPALYRTDGMLADCQLLRPDFEKVALSVAETDKFWKVEMLRISAREPFLNSGKPHANPPPTAISLQACDVIKDRNWLSDFKSFVSLNLKSEVDVALVKYLQQLYEMFLYVHGKFPYDTSVPVIAVDLLWHTHMCHPQFYSDDMTNLTGSVDRMDHVPWPQEGKHSTLPSPFMILEDHFAEEFGHSMEEFCMQRNLLEQAKKERQSHK